MRLLTYGLLVLGLVAWGAAPQAETSVPAEPAPAPESAPAPANSEVLLEYSIQDGAPQTAGGLESDPLQPVLSILKHSVQAAKAAGKAVLTEVRVRGDEELEAVLAAVPPLTVETSMGADGKGRSVFKLAPFRNKLEQDGDNGTLEWKGLDGTVTFLGEELAQADLDFKLPGLSFKIESQDDPADFNFKDLAFKLKLDADHEPVMFDFNLPQASLSADDGHMRVNRFTVRGNLSEVLPGLKLGDGSIRVGAFEFYEQSGADAKTPDYSFSGLSADGNAKLEKDLVDYTLDLKLEQVQIPQPDGGEMQNASYNSRLTLSKLDGEALAALSNTARQLKQQGVPEEMLMLSMMGKFFEMLPKLISHSPELALDNLKLDTGDGTVTGALDMKLDGTKPLNFQDPTALMAALSGQAHLSLAKSILTTAFKTQARAAQPGDKIEPAQIEQMAEQQIQALVQQNMLTPEGEDRYRMEAMLQDGKFLLNGKEMPLSGMIGPGAAPPQ